MEPGYSGFPPFTFQHLLFLHMILTEYIGFQRQLCVTIHLHSHQKVCIVTRDEGCLFLLLVEYHSLPYTFSHQTPAHPAVVLENKPRACEH